MSVLFSPWLEQLKRTRPVTSLREDQESDIAIIGAGIAGVMTAYFTLRHTSHDVLLIDAGKVAHGATGHNAGQLVSYFERSFADLVKEFGITMAAEGQAAVESAWVLLEEVMYEAKLQTPCYQFTGYAGCKDKEETFSHLEDNYFRVKGGLPPERLFIAPEAAYFRDIPDKYKGQYNILPQKDILKLLETNDASYMAALAPRKGCMNSAVFCEEVVGYLLATYPDRFFLAEETPIQRIILEEGRGILKTTSYTVNARNVVLCTNGFERLHIENTIGSDIDKKFHHLVRGSVGYMAAYLEPLSQPPTAISYLPKAAGHENAYETEPYFYLTRRPYEKEKNERHSLISVGGPEALMDDTNNYTLAHPYPTEAQSMIDRFLHRTYEDAPNGEIPYAFRWHGLMGYTPNGVRVIGFEPNNRVLLYNLGCNGVGILPSIYGGRRIAWLLQGRELAPSIFDPRNAE